jgi:hypothetical protein
MKTIIKLPKEQIVNLQFPKGNQQNQLERDILRQKLEKAVLLGNGQKIKVKLIIIDRNDQHYQVETTLWAVTEKHVMLKYGINIPLDALVDLEY